MQPRDPDPTQFMLWVALVLAIIACFFIAMDATGGTICEERCSTACIISSQEVCDACVEECESGLNRRIAPVGPSRQMGVDYTLHRTLGLTAVNYKDPHFVDWPTTIADIRDKGFTSSQLWARYSDLYCMGHWVSSNTWESYDPDCDAAWMLRYGGSTQIFVRLEHPRMIYFLAHRWYEMAWWRDLTIVLTRWEQDNELAQEEITYEEYMARWSEMKAEEEEIQYWLERARSNLQAQYPGAQLNVLNAMVVNRFPGYNVKPWAEGWPTVTEMIAEMQNKPDLVGVSYWSRGLDPTPALDWVSEVTTYPASRMFIAEFGATSNEQPQRYEDYIPLFWDWGINTILVWAWRSPWDGNRYEPTPDGLATLQHLNNEAINWRIE